jgi:hypothetical protein
MEEVNSMGDLRVLARIWYQVPRLSPEISQMGKSVIGEDRTGLRERSSGGYLSDTGFVDCPT